MEDSYIDVISLNDKFELLKTNDDLENVKNLFDSSKNVK